MQIRLNSIRARSEVDGPGLRAVLFLQGCPLACPGCQSRALWPATGGYVTPVHDLALTLATLARFNGGNITISGGEAFTQPAALAELVSNLRALGVKHIIVYTGYIWEQLFSVDHPARPWLKEILEGVDVLVDGRFVKELDNPYIIYRGSSNQRPIDVPASLAAGEVVTLDWSQPELVIREDGSLIAPEGLALELAEMGWVHHARMCGSVVSHAG